MAGPLFAIADYDPAFRLRLLDSLMGRLESVFMQVFTPDEFTELSGKIPYRSQKATLGRKAQTTQVAFDAAPLKARSSIDSVEVKYDGKFSRESEVAAVMAHAMGRIQDEEDLIEYLLQDCLMDIAVDIDLAFKPLLTTASTTNRSVAATAVWSDSSSAKPVTDLEALVDLVGNPDIFWLGKNYARELAKLPAVKDEVKQFEATDGGVSMQYLVDWLRSRFGFDEVIISADWYNSANSAQTLSKARIFDDVIWCGYKEHMVTIENPRLRETDSDYDRRRQVYTAFANIVVEAERADIDAGAVLTGA